MGIINSPCKRFTNCLPKQSLRTNGSAQKKYKSWSDGILFCNFLVDETRQSEVRRAKLIHPPRYRTTRREGAKIFVFENIDVHRNGQGRRHTHAPSVHISILKWDYDGNFSSYQLPVKMQQILSSPRRHQQQDTGRSLSSLKVGRHQDDGD